MIDPLLLEGLPDGFRITHRLADSTVAKGINAAGDIVGWYSRGSAQHGFLYSGGTYATIHILGDTSAIGINDLGHVVGSYMEPLGNNYFRFHGFCYIINSHVTIDHPPTLPSYPYTATELAGINAAGHMVGWYSDAHDAHKTKGLLYIHGLFFDIVHPSSFIQTNAVAINDRGQIVGHYGDSDLMMHGFLLSGHTYTTIEPPSAWWSVAAGINNNGQIVGYYFTRADTRYRGFLYNSNNNTFAAIDYPSAEHTMPNGINNNGQIVGSYRNKYPNLENHGFLLSGGTHTRLDVP